MGKHSFILDEMSKARVAERTSLGQRGLGGGDESAPYSHGQTMEAWSAFLTAKDRQSSPPSSVRGVIEESWHRSLKSGVDARGAGSTRIIPQSEIERLRLENDDLLDSARRTFQRIADTLGDAATMAIITDSSGIILDVGGDRKTIDDAHDIRLEIGAAWHEGVTGTNGIGTALATGQLTHVHAAEHFCEGVKSWSCVGAPIHSPVDDSVIGIVDFSGPHEIFHRHNIALALISANYIELALIEKIRIERMQLLEASLRRFPRVGAGDRVVVVDRFGRIIHHDTTEPQDLRALMSAAGAFASGQRTLGIGGMKTDNLEASLPQELRDYDVLPLKVNGGVRGAMLVIGSKTRIAPQTPVVSELFKTGVPRARQQIVGRSPALLEAIEKAERAASGRASILLEGETGVGKTSLARLVHAVSFPGGKAPFIAFNCGSVPGDEIDHALLGRSNAGPVSALSGDDLGLFNRADGGILFLDEIEAIPLELQPSLLHALEEPAIRRTAGTRSEAIRSRLIVATTRRLREEVSKGRFRKDLYFRLSVVKIAVPPLRNRVEDIEELLEHFNRHFAEKYDTQTLRFSSSIVDMLQSYAWPGNVRELRNLVESIILTATAGTVGAEHLSEDIRLSIASETSVSGASTRGMPTLGLNERRLIEQAVEAAGGNISKAAESLGVSRSTVYRKLNQYRSSP